MAPSSDMTIISRYTHHHTHDVSDRIPSLVSSELDEEEDQDEQAHRKEEQLLNYTQPCNPTPHAYSLTSGPLNGRDADGIFSHPSIVSLSGGARGQHHHHSASSASDSLSSAFHLASLQQEQHALNPVIHPFDHMKTLLSQFGSSISTSKAAFEVMRASSSPCASAEYAYSVAKKAMVEELETLSDLHMRLNSLIQQHDIIGMKQDSSHETSSNDFMGSNSVGNVGMQDGMLKSYEGIIMRFHDEITKKDAVTEALKEALARSMLKGEKLERRMKDLEAKHSSAEQQPK